MTLEVHFTEYTVLIFFYLSNICNLYSEYFNTISTFYSNKGSEYFHYLEYYEADLVSVLSKQSNCWRTTFVAPTFIEKDCVNINALWSPLPTLTASPEVDSFPLGCFFSQDETEMCGRRDFSFRPLFEQQRRKKNNRKVQLAGEASVARWPTSLLITDGVYLSHPLCPPHKTGQGDRFVWAPWPHDDTQTTFISRLSVAPGDVVAVFYMWRWH